jgi:hypothetical protein
VDISIASENEVANLKVGAEPRSIRRAYSSR